MFLEVAIHFKNNSAQNGEKVCKVKWEVNLNFLWTFLKNPHILLISWLLGGRCFEKVFVWLKNNSARNGLEIWKIKWEVFEKFFIANGSKANLIPQGIVEGGENNKKTKR